MGQQYLQIYGDPRPVNATVNPYGHCGPVVPGGHGYITIQSYAIPGHQIVQYAGPSVYAVPTSPAPAIIQASYPTGKDSVRKLFFVSRQVGIVLTSNSITGNVK